MYIYTTEYYSALKRKEIPTYARKQMKLKDTLSEISQAQKDKYHMIPFI